MNKLKQLVYLIILAVSIQSCSESTTCQISGKLKDLNTNKLLLVFDDPKSKTDSIFINAEKFFYTFSPDTVTLIRLVNNDGQYIPLFADKGWEINLEGSFEHPKISGNGPNKDYQDFLNIISKKEESEYKTEAIQFAQSHPESYASAYIINKYLIDIDNPDSDTILHAIQPLYGAVKDCRILSMHKGIIKEKKINERLVYYTFKDRNKKSIYSYNKDFDYTLINFWASWNKESCDIHDSIYNYLKDTKKKDLRVINCSLDYDRKEWNRKCKEDTPIWIETCDFKAWDNTLIETQEIKRLPANILIDRNRNIIGMNLFGKELQKKIKELTETPKEN